MQTQHPPREVSIQGSLRALALLWALAWVPGGAAQGLTGRTHAEQEFAQALAQTRALPLAHVEDLLRGARIQPRVQALIQPAAQTARRSWASYRQRFVNPGHITRGLAFWRQHRVSLEEAAARYGVPAAIVVAILGVETLYGQNTGNFPVLDALYTLAFHHPQPARPERVELFRAQLADLIELDFRGVLPARRSKGSFAGALGLPQFMPGSIKRFARDGDGDGRIDLFHSVPDAIASVAHFLRAHGWQPGLPVFAPVHLGDAAPALASHGLVPTHTWAQLHAAGARSDARAALWQEHPLGVIALVDEVKQTAEHRSVTPNFYALTHYNRSYFYAAAVADLAQALEDAAANTVTVP